MRRQSSARPRRLRRPSTGAGRTFDRRHKNGRTEEAGPVAQSRRKEAPRGFRHDDGHAGPRDRTPSAVAAEAKAPQLSRVVGASRTASSADPRNRAASSSPATIPIGEIAVGRASNGRGAAGVVAEQPLGCVEIRAPRLGRPRTHGESRPLGGRAWTLVAAPPASRRGARAVRVPRCWRSRSRSARLNSAGRARYRSAVVALLELTANTPQGACRHGNRHSDGDFQPMSRAAVATRRDTA